MTAPSAADGEELLEVDEDQIQAKRKQFAAALRACTAKERQLVRSLPLHGYRLWRAGEKLGYSKRGIALMLRRPRFQCALAAMNALEDLQTIVAHHRVLRELERLAHSNLKDFYDEEGNLLPPEQWSEEMGAAVCERSFDDRGRPKIRLHDKKGALDAIAKYKQMMPAARVELKLLPRNADDLTDEQLAVIATGGSAAPTEPSSGTD